ncbi:MAG: flagellar hook-basal body protein [Lachnospiraceae bacterium]|nr:flagellar hook-basal body protein [Lachnospiraceae bacterium]
MVRGLYTAWTGMANEQKRLDVISNNLANSATVGYKKEGVTSQSFDEQLAIKIKDKSEPCHERIIGSMSLGVKIGEVYTDYTGGSLRETENTFDLAIDGDGFFQVAVTDRAGETHIRYTRAGGFHMTSDGYVVNSEGNHLQGESGDVMVPTDAGEILVDIDGSIYADGEYVDRILLHDFEDYNYLKKYGDVMYEPVRGAEEKDATGLIRQGYTEQSNVNVISEMVNMIAITRAYEANQKVIQAIDQTLDNAANSIGRV